MNPVIFAKALEEEMNLLDEAISILEKVMEDRDFMTDEMDETISEFLSRAKP